VTVSTFRQFTYLSSLLVAMSLAATANAAPMFNVTELGRGFRIDQDPQGVVYGVENGYGGPTYAFDKSAMTYFPENGQPLVKDATDGHYDFVTSAGLSPVHTVAANGAGSISFHVISIGNYQQSVAGGGIVWTLEDARTPVEDLNAAGQVVGASQPYTRTFGPESWQFATFSDVGLKSHPNATNFADSTDNLNHYIASSLGIDLFLAYRIDDLGRILAEGTQDGQTKWFLLSPNGLSTEPIPNPYPTPEPSTLAFLTLGITALGIRSAHRRRNPPPMTAV
jgi:hypothetical protein